MAVKSKILQQLSYGNVVEFPCILDIDGAYLIEFLVKYPNGNTFLIDTENLSDYSNNVLKLVFSEGMLFQTGIYDYQINVIKPDSTIYGEVKQFVVEGNLTIDNSSIAYSVPNRRYSSFGTDLITEYVISNTLTPIILIPVISKSVDSGLNEWWNGSTSRIKPGSNNKTFLIRLNIQARPVNFGQLPILISSVDISDGSGSPIYVSSSRQNLTSSSYEEVTFIFSLYARNTFFTNGGLLEIKSLNGNSLIKNVNIFITE